MASGSVAGTSALRRPHHAQGVRGAHVGRLGAQDPWGVRGDRKQAWQGQEAGRPPGRQVPVWRVVGGQAKWEAEGLGVVDVVPILQKQFPEAAGYGVEVELRGREEGSEIGDSCTPFCCRTQAYSTPAPAPLRPRGPGPQLSLLSDHRVLSSNRIQESRHSKGAGGAPPPSDPESRAPALSSGTQTEAGSSFTPGPSCKAHLPVPTSQRGILQRRDQSRLSESRQGSLASTQGSWSLYRPWVLRATLSPAGTGHVGAHVATRGSESQDSASQATLSFTGLVTRTWPVPV